VNIFAIGAHPDDEEEDSSSSGSSAWDFSYLGGNDSGNDNSYDAADANARSMGFNDANDAANRTGWGESNWYY